MDVINFPKEVEELINFAQFSSSFEVPTSKGATQIFMSLLWEGELVEISKKTAEMSNPSDGLTRGELMKTETLVYAIDKIGEEYFRADDPEENKLLKNKLRMILQKSSPALIEYMWDRYNDLVQVRNKFVSEKTEEFKKKFQEEILKIKPL